MDFNNSTDLKNLADLRELTDEVLLKNTQQAAQDERAATTRLLRYLCEVQRRRLFAQFHCASLFEFCVKVLLMSEPQAGRRVNAARLLKEFPQIEEKINSGALSLTAVSTAQTFFNREAKAEHPVSFEKKAQILEKLEHKSTRETESLLLSHATNPNVVLKERLRLVTESLTEIKFTASKETLENLERLKEIWSTQMPGANYAEIIQKMAQFCRKQLDPTLKAQRAMVKNQSTKQRAGERAQVKKQKAVANNYGSQASKLTTEQSTAQNLTPAPESLGAGEPAQAQKFTPAQKSVRSRYIPSVVRQEVWMRDGGVCAFVDVRTGQRCGSRHRLQLDHQVPFARGGVHSAENLRLRCFAHNQLHAIQAYGASVLKYARL